MIGKISYLPSYGSFGPGTIYLKMSGLYEGKVNVAVSQVQKSKYSVDVDTLHNAQSHPNVWQFYCHEQNSHFMLVNSSIIKSTMSHSTNYVLLHILLL